MGAILVDVACVAIVFYADKGKNEGGHSGPLLNVPARLLTDRRWGLSRVKQDRAVDQSGLRSVDKPARSQMLSSGERLS
jgi:hypothetical protein